MEVKSISVVEAVKQYGGMNYLRALILIIGRGNISAIKTPISFISLTPIQLRPILKKEILRVSLSRHSNTPPLRIMQLSGTELPDVTLPVLLKSCMACAISTVPIGFIPSFAVANTLAPLISKSNSKCSKLKMKLLN
jgi:hypothetical protein